MGGVTADTGRKKSAADEVPWLSAGEQENWRALVSLFMTLPTALDNQLKREAGINAFEFHVLAGLSEAENHTLLLSDLATYSRGSLSRLSHALTRLEREGWVERRACGQPGRRVEARLTDSGWAKVQATAPGHVREARRTVVDVLTAEQLAALGEAARAITAAAQAGQPPQ